MRSLVLVLPAMLGGCEGQLCALLGEYQGSFEGDLQGQLDAVLSEDPKNGDTQALVDFTLSTVDTELSGNGHVMCEDGELTLDLRDLDGTKVGDVDGLLGDGEGSGDWSLLTGEKGTWHY
jgi:hypothetical protein